MMKRVMAETPFSLLMRSRATIIPRGSEKSSVRKKMAQVLPRPSLILTIMVISDIRKPSFTLFHIILSEAKELFLALETGRDPSLRSG